MCHNVYLVDSVRGNSPLRTHTHTHTHTQVYCRLRPLRNDEQESCADVISDSVLQFLPPECSLAYKSGHKNAVSGKEF